MGKPRAGGGGEGLGGDWRGNMEIWDEVERLLLALFGRREGRFGDALTGVPSMDSASCATHRRVLCFIFSLAPPHRSAGTPFVTCGVYGNVSYGFPNVVYM